MNILITGGGVSNKGAQAMLFITVEQMQRKYPDDEIIVLTVADSDFSRYRFRKGKIAYYALKHTVKPMNVLKRLYLRVKPEQTAAIDRFFKDARLLIDISGYALGSNWAESTVDYYLSCIECARKYQVPVYVMPQSFGPFDYPENGEMMKRIADTMAYPAAVYAREQEGYDLLTGKFGLKNVKLTCDMVLQCESASPENICRSGFTENPLPQIRENSAAIIPNVRVCDHTGKEEIVGYYRAMAETLLRLGKTVYLLYHSGEDAGLCAEIAQALGENDNVVCLNRDFDCFEYEKLVRNFDFIIASRYHAIVHALKNGVPCMAFGWAVKYGEVLRLCGLEGYAFDIRERIDESAVADAIETMNNTAADKKAALRDTVEKLQKEDLFAGVQ